ncbi:hypothetical protein HNR73_001400 [Phytomonospora endophytica]|uniref:Uncharacterized protein n=1 Tax=Phytomonospora endophytica TaxID=714109 RepID=A0A841FNN4_9ACTN|nr:hypothetical protein [Phytomonospora endophytica]
MSCRNRSVQGRVASPVPVAPSITADPGYAALDPRIRQEG